MKIEAYIASYLPEVENEMQKIVDEMVPSENLELRSMMAYHLGWEGEGAGHQAQGKRIRPLLLLLVSSTLADSWKTKLSAAAAVELLHNFSLIHDDIQDASDLRRNRPTVWVKWGIPQAINAGDAMFTLAQLALLRLENLHTPDIVVKASQILNQACIQLTYGQFLDISYEKRNDLHLQDYWPMIEGKTACLLSACTTLGATLAHGSDKVIEIYRQFGRKLGLAFQIQDDLLGIWGNQEKLGKSTESDLAAGKKTFPVLYANDQKGVYYHRWGYRPVPLDEIPDAVQALTAEGAYAYTQATCDDLTKAAIQSLEEAHRQCTNHEAYDALVELTFSLLQRTS